MKSIARLKLYGYTVRGLDLRDGADFEDHIVVSDLDVISSCEHTNYIINLYAGLGFQVSETGIIPDEEPGYNPDKGITIDLDSHQLYFKQIKMLKEQQNNKL